MNKTFYFIRHGESIANAGGKAVENRQILLSETGKAQADELAERFVVPPVAVYTSTMLRTQLTAEPYCKKYNITPITSSLLDEISVLSIELIEKTSTEYRRSLAAEYWEKCDPTVRMGENADTFTEFYDRVNRFREVMPNFQSDTIFFTHGFWIKMLILQLNGFKCDMARYVKDAAEIPTPNCVIYKFTSTNLATWSVSQVQ